MERENLNLPDCESRSSTGPPLRLLAFRNSNSPNFRHYKYRDMYVRVTKVVADHGFEFSG